MGKFKECGVHSVEQLTEHHIHSLATQRVQEAQEKWKDSRDGSSLLLASPYNRLMPPLLSEGLTVQHCSVAMLPPSNEYLLP